MSGDKELGFLSALAAKGGQASMWEVGEAIGLDRDETEALALELMGEGALEMVSLSGAVRLTEAGKVAAGGESAQDAPDLTEFISRVRGVVNNGGMEAGLRRDLEADLATMEAQLKRTNPLAVVIGACLKEMADLLEALGHEEAKQLAALALAFKP